MERARRTASRDDGASRRWRNLKEDGRIPNRASTGRRSRAALTLLLIVFALTAWLASPAPAGADGSGAALGVPGMSEQGLREFEERTLGPAHAAEHASQRRTLRLQKQGHGASAGQPPAQGVRSGDDSSAEAFSASGAPMQALAAPVSTDPAISGRWSAPFSIPVMAINAAVLPTGKVLWYAYPRNPAPRFGGTGAPNTAQAWLWDPATGQTKRVDPPLWRDPADGQLKPANIWCSGTSFLADGRVLVTGGNLGYSGATPNFRGLNKIYTFNPFNETWTEQPDMPHGRWYPSQALLPDGRALIMSGLDESGADFSTNKDIELFTPSADLNGVGTLTKLGQRGGGGPPDGDLYPHLFVMPSGRTLVAGPDRSDSWFLNAPGNPATLSWSDAADPNRRRLWATGVFKPGASGSEVMQIGGSDPNYSTSPPSNTQGVTSTESFDEANPGLGWRAGGSLNVGRSHHNSVLLPDGSMVTVGGGFGSREPEGQWAADPDHRQVELYDPAAGSWRLGAAQAEFRAYHSTAVLLPDGRVISAGDDYNGGTDRDSAEIYEPPYLFKGARPTISSAPNSVGLGETFAVDTPSTNVTRAALVAPSATTHANDMNQRYVPLSVTQRSGGVSVTAPASANRAPPGYYMLFLLDDQGVPSVAKFVRLNGSVATVPGEDKAAGQPASASSTETIGLEPDKAVDRDSSTRWSSAFTDSQWWQVDLGRARQVDSVELNWEIAHASRYRILTSLDGTTFTEAADVSISEPGLKQTSFSARSARYVRIEGVTRATEYGISFWDARVYGPPDGSPDTTPPDTTISGGPTGTTSSTSASLSFTSEPGASFECRLDGGSFGACSSPKAYSGLADGQHTFEVRAKDAAGNLDPSPASRSWTVATAQPTTTYSDLVRGTAGLTSYWRLGDSGTTAADSAGTNSGSFVGGTSSVPGLIAGDQNTARDFDGSNDFADFSPTLFGTPTTMSIEAWVRVDTQKPAGGLHTLVTNSSNDHNDGFTLAIDETRKARLTVAQSGGVKGTALGARTLATNTTYHVVGTYDGTAVRLFINGAADGSVAYSSGISYLAGRDLLLGKQFKPFNQSIRYLDGRLDEVALYDRALSAAAVQEHYAKGTAP